MQVVIYSFGAERKNKMAIYEKQNYGFLTERLYNVSLNLFSVGKNTYKKPWHWESKPVEYYTLHYVLEGTGSYSVLGNEFHTKAGDAVLIYPNSLATIDTDNYLSNDKKMHLCIFVLIHNSELKKIFSLQFDI